LVLRHAAAAAAAAAVTDAAQELTAPHRSISSRSAALLARRL